VATLKVSKPGVLPNYRELLKRAEEQQVLARKMIARAREMSRVAVTMRERPYRLLLP